MKNFKFLNVTLILLLLAQTIYAQQLPNAQAGSIWIPPSVKIDGKLLEWTGSLKAYNKATSVEYIVANDDKNLYIAVRSKDKTITAKILAGGITVVINAPGKNNFNEGPSLTFPATNSGYAWTKTGLREANFKLLSDSTAIRKAIPQFKDIKVLRFKGISDSILSVYNEYGIKPQLAYNETFTCELLIPLDRLGISSQGFADFAYGIRLNGVPIPPRPKVIAVPPPPPAAVLVSSSGQRAAPGTYINENEIQYPTFFWGKYTLSKKP